LDFTVLGEGAAQLAPVVKDQFPGIPWSRPTQLRNRIAHGYWSIDLEVLQITATDFLPAFVEQLRAVLASLEGE
jgi:uncharacterized protein with HEPN domain